MIGQPKKVPCGWLTIVALLALLTGCGDAGDDSETAGALTAAEAKQLSNAAEMLDVSNRPPLPDNSLAP